MWDRKELKAAGKAAFKKNYWPCVLVAAVLSILTAAEAWSLRGNTNSQQISVDLSTLTPEQLQIISISLLIGIVIALLINIFITNPLIVGGYHFFVRNCREEKPSAGILFSAYKEGRFGKIFATMFLNDLYLILWSLLFIIPGVIKYYSYRMVPYILAEHPEMSANEVITMSRKMMDGHKWNAFVLDLSFILWHLLGCLTLGIGELFYVIPYEYSTNAELYEALKK